MKLSQIGTKLCVLMALATLTSAASALTMAPGTSETAPNEFRGRLIQLLQAQNRPLPSLLTSPDGQLPRPHGMQPMQVGIPQNPLGSVRMGGVSDGGGNAVGKTLFDFAENDGSVSLTLEELIALEPLEGKMLDFINRSVPGVGFLDSGKMGDLMKAALAPKKIYLESKPLDSKNCLNQSLVFMDKQVVVACQSDLEVRFSLSWLLSTDAVNRAGLINHELTLAWARNRDQEDDKVNLETKVREWNRDCFSGQNGDQIAQSLTDLFSVKTFNARIYSIGSSIPARLMKSMTQFCQKPYDVSGDFKEIVANKDLAQDSDVVPTSLTDLLKASQEQGSKDFAEARNHACEDYDIDRKPLHVPQMKNLDQRCVYSLDQEINGVVAILKDKQMSIGDRRMTLGITVTGIKSSGDFCSELKIMQYGRFSLASANQIAAAAQQSKDEAINYVRYQLRKQGYNFHFMDDLR